MKTKAYFSKKKFLKKMKRKRKPEWKISQVSQLVTDCGHCNGPKPLEILSFLLFSSSLFSSLSSSLSSSLFFFHFFFFVLFIALHSIRDIVFEPPRESIVALFQFESIQFVISQKSQKKFIFLPKISISEDDWSTRLTDRMLLLSFLIRIEACLLYTSPSPRDRG